VYEEFSAIFLLAMTYIHRYDLSIGDLGVARDSFVPKYLAQGHVALPYESLTEEQQKQTAAWVKGLFNPDSITDEVLQSCRPQEFYLLFTTILSQIFLAVISQVIDPREAVKTPIECKCIITCAAGTI
jgi:mediator of RNA polymerase II transcription subunit 5